MHSCPFCNARVTDGDSHCQNCGGPQTAPVVTSGTASAHYAGPTSRAPLDPWMITHPNAKSRFQNDARALNPMVQMWKMNPDMAGTIATQQQITQALQSHAISMESSYYFCCPWAPIYDVLSAVTIGGQQLRRGQQFTFDVSAEEMGEGGAFKSEISVGNFSPTDNIDYCDPGEEHGGHTRD